MTNCIICGKPKGYDVDDNLFCKSCYYTKVKAIREKFDHDKYPRQIFEHYLNLKYSQNFYDKEEFCEKICTMFALAQELEYIHKDASLSLCVKQDIIHLTNEFNNSWKQGKNKTKYSFNDRDYRALWPRDCQCDDGHYVRSVSEKAIDDWLYNHNLQHSYEPCIIPRTHKSNILIPDFYLKEYDTYIEYWGIEDTPSYAKRKEEKIEIYDKNNIDVIHLTQKDINRLNDLMKIELEKRIKK